MLKKFFYLMLSVFILSACGGSDADDSVDPENPLLPEEPEKEVLALDEHRFEVPSEGGTISVKVTGNVDYTVTVPEAFRSWISGESAKVAQTHNFAISENEELEAREGYIVFAGGTLKDTVYVVQAGVVGKDFTETVSGVSNVSFDMVYVKGGTFQMGATSEQGDDYGSYEKPVHEVTLSDYYMGAYPVTQGLWKAVMGSNPSYFANGDNYPVENVSWNDVQEFLSKLNQLTGKKYVLPTEAQWEYAARGGEKSQGYKYSGGNDIDEVAWYRGNSEEKYTTSPVGTKKANELGIYDMSGNVWEWCQDWYGSYSSEAQTNPTGPESGSDRVLRGGCWFNNAWFCRVSIRFNYNPGDRPYYFGFRLVLLP